PQDAMGVRDDVGPAQLARDEGPARGVPPDVARALVRARRTSDPLKWCPGPAGKARREHGTGVVNPRVAGRGRASAAARADSRALVAAQTERCIAAPAEELRRTRAGAVQWRLWEAEALGLVALAA